MNQFYESLCAGQSLTTEQSRELFAEIVGGEVDPILMAGLLTALKIKGETPDEIAGAAQALRHAAKEFPRPAGQVVDIVGTGGDGLNTINISSTSVLVAAAAGVTVCKHGNRSVSSKSGSADLLRTLGVNISMSPNTAAQALEQSNACFIFAPEYHSGIRHAMPVRGALKSRTIFNVLGPLINPASPDVMLLGVYAPELLEPIAKALVQLGVTRAFVVHGSGLDEIALHGPTQIAEVNQSEITLKTVTPADFGVEQYPVEDLVGGTPEENAEIAAAILAGNGTSAHNAAIAVNVGAVLYLTGKAESLIDGTSQALDVLASGAAIETLATLCAVSNSDAGESE
ncbi:anthranilate phosphoribosyltransferase [Echinimonas agarilytica]|uniref:Anthranilate phosphoribosyltransferase n=2 Tax=Echinimonas agarilytica TaxID=1215918 RepID=A0AA41W650_9GAMM|nr:anthranilate phosphoribosyltransferase [Echinimonas agarilytica]MCM2679490.1 anthranilate phosphoribosyltransferase [Echinimonas agarilytica]